MTDEPRMHELLDELLSSQATPEDVCRSCPELLPELRERWQQMCRVRAELDALFPPLAESGTGPPALPQERTALPQIPGYEVEAVLGRGGMGVVFRARHLRLNRTVALKMLIAGGYAAPGELRRFRREAQALAGLLHPNIVQVHDAGDVEGRPFFTMELVEGGPLSRQLAGRPQPTQRAAEVVTILAGAVQFAHRSGIVHRDLKPANILLTEDDTLKISDFGLAQFLEEGDRLTASGARLGTPCYMAPEQTLGKVSAIGPAVDIYALGVILYELLTGRPPFEVETAAEIERRVLAEEPVPPSRTNAKVPRDLETICLKCLHKNAARRYASAQDLADDLHRFLDGKPVVARPVGVFERAGKWARRRPALATLMTALLLLLGAAAGLGLWLQHQASSRAIEKGHRQLRARQAIETTIYKAYESGRAERWDEAKRILAGAANHLPDADADELRSRVAQAKTNLQFAQDLEAIRTKSVDEIVDRFIGGVPDYRGFAEGYSKAFASANFDVEGDSDAAATRVRSAPLAEQTIAALDLWAFAAFRQNRGSLQKQLLRIAQLADPDPAWRDHFRNPSLWRDRQALLRLAYDAPKTPEPPLAHQLAIAGALLTDLDRGERDEQMRLLRDALDHRPGDFWLNWEMAIALSRNRRYAESATYLRIVNALRPSSLFENSLGITLDLAGEFDESVRHLRAAVVQEPRNRIYSYNLAVDLARANRLDEAEAQCRHALEVDPNDFLAYQALGMMFWDRARFDDAVPMFQKAAERAPRVPAVLLNLGAVLFAAGRYAEALTAFQDHINQDQTRRDILLDRHRGAGQCLAKLGRHDEAIAEFLWVIRELDSAKRRADVDPSDGVRYGDAQVGLTESLVCLGRFKEGGAAARLVWGLPTLAEPRHEVLQRQLNICQELAPLETKLPAILADNDQPADVATRRALAEWCYKYRRLPAAAVRLFDGMFLKQPLRAEDLQTRDRFHAACATALAGNGLGDDAAKLTERERSVLRKKSLEWLRADRDAWASSIRQGRSGDPNVAAQSLRGWLENDDLACVRNQAALAQLPEPERKEWQALWADVKALALPDPAMTLKRARAHAARKQWAQAAETYAQFFKDVPNDADGENWFEFAAAQLLSGDLQGYRHTCQRMLDGAHNALKLRPYLVGRACTLAPGSVANAELPAKVSAGELMANPTVFWSLTEQGAVDCRRNRLREAVALFNRSLDVDGRSGTAVVNWLWLALASHKLGENERARRWLDKADAFLDSVGSELPANAEHLFGLHLHNWLEAHVLRREAAALLSPSPAK
jgi:tetratricopeptide (TPR) repeat protein